MSGSYTKTITDHKKKKKKRKKVETPLTTTNSVHLFAIDYSSGAVPFLPTLCVQNGFKFSTSKTVCMHFHQQYGASHNRISFWERHLLKL